MALHVHSGHSFINPGLAKPIVAPRTNLHSAQLLNFSTLVTTNLYSWQSLSSLDGQWSA